MITDLLPPRDTLELEVARGKLKGFSFIDKFGKRSGVGSGSFVDIWSAGIDYTFSAGGVEMFISSSDAGDTQQIEVQTLDENFLEATILVTLAGQTKTRIGTTELISRVLRIKNLGEDDIAGDVWIYEDDTVDQGVPDTDSKKRGHMNGDNQSQIAIYTIPANKTGYLYLWNTTLDKPTTGASADSQILVREFGSVFRVQKPGHMSTDGEGEFRYPYIFPLQLSPKADVKVQANPNQMSTDVTGGFVILLLEE